MACADHTKCRGHLGERSLREGAVVFSWSRPRGAGLVWLPFSGTVRVGIRRSERYYADAGAGCFRRSNLLSHPRRTILIWSCGFFRRSRGGVVVGVSPICAPQVFPSKSTAPIITAPARPSECRPASAGHRRRGQGTRSCKCKRRSMLSRASCTAPLPLLALDISVRGGCLCCLTPLLATSLGMRELMPLCGAQACSQARERRSHAGQYRQDGGA